VSKDNDHIDRDTMAAVTYIQRRGATRIMTGGASCGGTQSVAVAPRIRGYAGLIFMSSPMVCGPLNGIKIIKTVRQPSFFAVSPGSGDSQSPDFERQVRTMYTASGAKDKRLVLVPDAGHGTEMLRSKGGPMLQAKLLAFITDAFRAAG
jgi:hypothetical protein